MKKSLCFCALALLISSLPAAELRPGDFVAQGPSHGKRIALTFDDGPGPNTEKFLDLLKQNHVHATFFIQGDQTKLRPLVAQRIVREGHEVGSHTMDHVNYLKRQKQLMHEEGTPRDRDASIAEARTELVADMKQSREVIEKVTGVKLALLRMPHGIDRPWVKEAAKEAGFILVNWTYGMDWTSPPPDPSESLKRTYVQAMRPGTIFLIHDGWPHSEKSLAVTEALLKAAREKGYEIVTAGELIGLSSEAPLQTAR